MSQEEQLGSLPEQDHDHDVLLIAGSRPEVARLAPVATAFAAANRITALTVATGTDPWPCTRRSRPSGCPPTSP
jgi:UDP-N-acetylglucosamine 2-epimerase (non-hydrolysing)